MMLKNADCTVYEKETFIRHEIQGVYWYDARGASVAKNGVQIADSVLVYLYDTDYVPKPGDIVVKGVCDFIFNAGSQKAASESMRQFRELYPEYAVAKTVSDARYGGLPHIEVTAR